MCDMEDFWVFGYGLFMWKLGFVFEEWQIVCVYGYWCLFCICFWVYCGMCEKLGFVFGFDCGGSCKGVVFWVLEVDCEVVIVYLCECELVINVYFECFVQVWFVDGCWVCMLIYVVDLGYEQFEWFLSFEEVVGIVVIVVGVFGDNFDYVCNMVIYMCEFGIWDYWFESVLVVVVVGVGVVIIF